eukprot:8848728-Lingulodinium_polyedra.AAC.1
MPLPELAAPAALGAERSACPAVPSGWRAPRVQRGTLSAGRGSPMNWGWAKWLSAWRARTATCA